MKKLFSILTLLALLLSFSACSQKINSRVPDGASKIVMTQVTDGSSVTITDKDFIKNITDHINYFDFKKVKDRDLKNVSSCYTIKWFDEKDTVLRTISLYSDGTGAFFEGKQYEIDGDLYLDIPYFNLIFENFSNRTLYRLPLSLVRSLFDVTSLEGFWEKELPFYKDCEDFREQAYLESDVLLLFLTDKQKAAWLQYFDSGIDDFAKQEGVTLAKDYSKITIIKPTSEDDEFLYDKLPILAPHEMVLRQILSGKDASVLSAEVEIIAEKGNEVLYSAKWPYEELAAKW